MKRKYNLVSEQTIVLVFWKNWTQKISEESSEERKKRNRQVNLKEALIDDLHHEPKMRLISKEVNKNTSFTILRLTLVTLLP